MSAPRPAPAPAATRAARCLAAARAARRLAPAALALAAAALGPATARAEPVGPPLRTAPPAARPAEAAAGAKPAALPEVSTPAPLEFGRAPARVPWSYEVEGLRVVSAEGLPPDQSPQLRRLLAATTAQPKARAKKAPAPRRAESDTALVRIEGASTPALVAYAWQAPEARYARSLSLPCRPSLEAPVRWPLRWETLQADEADAPLWQVNDGWYDEKSCQLSVEHRTALRPAVLVRQGAQPALLAAREGDVVTFLLAPTRTIVAHELSGALQPTLGPFTRVRVPAGPGHAATLVATFAPATLNSWWKRPGQNALPLSARPGQPSLLEVRVDVSQTVGERVPTLAVQRLTDLSDEPLALEGFAAAGPGLELSSPPPPPPLRALTAPEALRTKTLSK